MGNKLTIEAAVGNLEILADQYEEILTRVEAFETEFDNASDQLIARIKAGETTGDRFLDMTIVAYGFPDRETAKDLARVDLAVTEDGEGELCLTLYEQLNESGVTVSSQVALTVLGAGPMRVNILNGTCSLPGEKSAFTEDYSFPGVEVRRGGHDFLSAMNVDENHAFLYLGGAARIIDWARAQDDPQKFFDLLYVMTKAIEYALPEIPELDTERRKALDEIWEAPAGQCPGTEEQRVE